MIRYTLTYSELEGGAVTQAHIHFGRRAVNGGIIAWLCGTADESGPAGTPTCPQPAGTCHGDDSRCADRRAELARASTPAQFAELVGALRAGVVYANVHTATLRPGGEIRGQVNDKARSSATRRRRRGRLA